MPTTFILRLVACALLATASGGAMAQYVWLDDKGVKQYSDMPPPAGTPANRVLKSAGARPPATAPEAAAGPSVAERNAAFEKRRIEQAERDKKESEQARQAADMARNCEQARAYSRLLASGERIARMDRNGERSYLSDQDRAQEAETARRALEACR